MSTESLGPHERKSAHRERSVLGLCTAFLHQRTNRVSSCSENKEPKGSFELGATPGWRLRRTSEHAHKQIETGSRKASGDRKKSN
jgi:hypothetical protein